jgi:hypothetical protein
VYVEGISAVACLALALFDGWFTRRRLRKYGHLVELNALAQTNPFLATLAPTIVGVSVALWAHWDLLLGVILGARLLLATFQLRSRETERQLDVVRRALPPLTPFRHKL